MSVRRGFIIVAILLAVVGCAQQQAQEPLENVQIVERSPGVSANSVAVGSAVTVTFNVDMNPETISADTLTLRVSLPAEIVAGDVTYDAITRTATLTPAVDLMPETVYVATVTGGVRSANGGTLDGVAAPTDRAWSFLTAEAGSAAPLVGGPYASSTTVVRVAMAPLSPNVSGGTLPYAFALTAGALPAGVTLDPATGAISGTPTAVGPFVGTVRVTDDEGAVAELAFDIEVRAEVVVPGPLIGSAYADSSTVAGSEMAPLSPNVAGGTPPYAFSLTVGALPDGVALDAATGVISGTPTAAGSFPGTVRVTDDAGEIADLAFDLTVTPAPPPPKLSLSYTGTPYPYEVGADAEIAPASDVVVLNATGEVSFSWVLVTEDLNDDNWFLDEATGAIRREASGRGNNLNPDRNGDRTYLVTVEDELGETASFLVAFEGGAAP